MYFTKNLQTTENHTFLGRAENQALTENPDRFRNSLGVCLCFLLELSPQPGPEAPSIPVPLRDWRFSVDLG